MMGIMQLAWSEVQLLTLRELIQQYDAFLVNQWDQTALIASIQYNTQVTITNALGGKAKPKWIEDFHPYRKKPKRGLRVNASNIKKLMAIGDMLVKKG